MKNKMMVCDICGYKEEYRKGSMQFCRGECMEKGYRWITMEGLPKPTYNIIKEWLIKNNKKMEGAKYDEMAEIKVNNMKNPKFVKALRDRGLVK